MKSEPFFMIIGGDSRFSYVEDILKNKGFDALRIFPGEYTAEDFKKTDIFILPVPVSRDNLTISTPESQDNFCFDDFLSLLPHDCIVTGGLFSEKHKNQLKEKNIKVFDYYKNDSLAIKNAVPTAEGVIGILINALPVTIDGLKCAVTGYGRCAKAICDRLISLGADVTCVVRRGKSFDKAFASGIKLCTTDDFDEKCTDYDAVINTVPEIIIDRTVIRNLKKSCLIIEIASAPFGTDFDCAKEYGINTIRAGSLPGRTAAMTAGNIIADTILEFYGSDTDDN